MDVRELHERLGRILADHDARKGNRLDQHCLDGAECRADLPILARVIRRGGDGRTVRDHFARVTCVRGGVMGIGGEHFGLELILEAAPAANLPERVR